MPSPIQQKLLDNKIVYLPPGVYTSSEQLIVPPGCQLFGASSRYTVLDFPAGIVVGGEATVHDLWVRGTGAGTGLSATGEQYTKLRDIKVSGYNTGVLLNTCTSVTVQNCILRDNKRTHLQLTDCLQCNVSKNDFIGLTMYCMYLQNSTFCRIYFNNFWQAINSAIYSPIGPEFINSNSIAFNQYSLSGIPRSTNYPIVEVVKSSLAFTDSAYDKRRLSIQQNVQFEDSVSLPDRSYLLPDKVIY